MSCLESEIPTCRSPAQERRQGSRRGFLLHLSLALLLLAQNLGPTGPALGFFFIMTEIRRSRQVVWGSLQLCDCWTVCLRAEAGRDDECPVVLSCFASRGSRVLVQGSGSGENILRLLAHHGDFLELPFSEGRCYVTREAELKGTQP